MEKIKILIPLDGSERSTHSIGWLKKYFPQDEAKVTLLNVLSLYFEYEATIQPEEIDILKHNAQLSLDEAAKGIPEYEVETVVRFGNDFEKILDAADEGGFDIIIMTRSGKSGIARALGSVTAKVVKNSKIPVFVVPS